MDTNLSIPATLSLSAKRLVISPDERSVEVSLVRKKHLLAQYVVSSSDWSYMVEVMSYPPFLHAAVSMKPVNAPALAEPLITFTALATNKVDVHFRDKHGEIEGHIVVNRLSLVRAIPQDN